MHVEHDADGLERVGEIAEGGGHLLLDDVPVGGDAGLFGVVRRFGLVGRGGGGRPGRVGLWRLEEWAAWAPWLGGIEGR